MKTQKIAIAIAGGLMGAMALLSAMAQPPIITSFQGNGQLTWTNLAGTNCFTVQWAPAVAGPWSTNWDALNALVTSNSQTMVSVPMFYRVAQGFSLASLRGTWILIDPTNGNNFFTAQDDGILSECSMYNPSRPAGYFTVGVSGRLTNSFVFTHDGVQTLTGTFASANLIALDSPYTNDVISRVVDVSRCAGNWTGTLFQTNGPGLPASYPVSFSVDTRGLVTNFAGNTNFPDYTGSLRVTLGRMFALTNGIAVGFFYPGDKSDSGAYDQFDISGTLTGDVFAGSYNTDSGSGTNAILGTASFTRQ